VADGCGRHQPSPVDAGDEPATCRRLVAGVP